MQSSLDATAALSDQKAKIEQYRAALQHVIRSASVDDAKVFVDHSEHCINQGAFPSDSHPPFPRPQAAPNAIVAMHHAQCCRTRCLWSSAASSSQPLPRTSASCRLTRTSPSLSSALPNQPHPVCLLANAPQRSFRMPGDFMSMSLSLRLATVLTHTVQHLTMGMLELVAVVAQTICPEPWPRRVQCAGAHPAAGRVVRGAGDGHPGGAGGAARAGRGVHPRRADPCRHRPRLWSGPKPDPAMTLSLLPHVTFRSSFDVSPHPSLMLSAENMAGTVPIKHSADAPAPPPRVAGPHQIRWHLIARCCDVHTPAPRHRSPGCAGMRQLDAEYRLDKNIKIAMLYLEDDDAVSAEAFIKKASALIGSCKVHALHEVVRSMFSSV